MEVYTEKITSCTTRIVRIDWCVVIAALTTHRSTKLDIFGPTQNRTRGQSVYIVYTFWTDVPYGIKSIKELNWNTVSDCHTCINYFEIIKLIFTIICLHNTYQILRYISPAWIHRICMYGKIYFKLLCLAKDHWRAFSTQNAHMIHI